MDATKAASSILMETGWRSLVAVTCNKDCGGGCPLVAEVDDGRVTRVRDNPLAGRTMKGCARGYEMPRVVYAPDRVLKLLLRTGPRGSGQFREAGWPEALEVAARGLAEVQSRFGAGSILTLAGFDSGR